MNEIYRKFRADLFKNTDYEIKIEPDPVEPQSSSSCACLML